MPVDCKVVGTGGLVASMRRSVDVAARPGGGPSGVGRYAEALVRELQALGVDAQTVSSFDEHDGSLYALARRRGVDVAAFLASYPLAVHRRPGAILHLTAQNFATALWYGEPDVVTVHDLLSVYYPPGARGLLTRVADAAARFSLRLAPFVVADSRATAAQCLRRSLAPLERLTVVPLGVDHAVFHRQAVPEGVWRRIGVEPGTPFLLYVGTEARRKQVSFLIRLLARLRARGLSDLVLVKVGAPMLASVREELQMLAAALDVAEAVRWLDHVDEACLAHLYNLALVYVSASTHEGFGLPVLEAMACGCPVVVTAIGPHVEVVGSAGVLLPTGDLNVWTETLLALLRDEGRLLELAHMAETRAAAFSWRRTAQETLAVYEQAAHRLRW